MFHNIKTVVCVRNCKQPSQKKDLDARFNSRVPMDTFLFGTLYQCEELFYMKDLDARSNGRVHTDTYLF